jgi:glycine/D-amino acid oxidase-like deaminating enzyme
MLMQTETLIVGQGLCGTWLSYWLQKAGHHCIVIDEERPMSSSRIASGVINPVTGRGLVETWMAPLLLPFCLQHYTAIGKALGIECIQTMEILHCFPTEDMRAIFQKRLPQLSEYLKEPEDLSAFGPYFYLPHGLGIIHPALLINVQLLLTKWRALLVTGKTLQEEKFDTSFLQLQKDHVLYKDLKAKRIIFCDGVDSLLYPFFNKLPFTPNKGEALLIKVAGLPRHRMYKKTLSLVPFSPASTTENDQYFWAGSTYDNKYADELPSALFRQRTMQQIANWLKLPFTVEDHFAGIRPTNIERRPFVGMHPNLPQVGILNGMGTKGCSLAPYMAMQLADQLTKGSAIDAEAGLERFSRILAAPPQKH